MSTFNSSSATSTLSSRTSGVSSGETGSSTGPESPDHKTSNDKPATAPKRIGLEPSSAITANNHRASAIEPIPQYQRRYATLTKPKPQSPQKSAALMRNHSFQAVTNRQKLIQSENSAFFKVPSASTATTQKSVDFMKPMTILSTPAVSSNGGISNTAKFFAKESHPNKFLTSTPIKDSMAFKPLHNAGAAVAAKKPLRQASFNTSATTRRLLPQINGLSSSSNIKNGSGFRIISENDGGGGEKKAFIGNLPNGNKLYCTESGQCVITLNIGGGGERAQGHSILKVGGAGLLLFFL